ncbi:hypothetical protein ACH5RR_020425 [Cinchona calisaya]|uniref:Ninja-family protein n=1 Tax=Cinchona calisaya TaxID=153742 RepID=A0ABD2ZEE9_9GENT
MLEVNDEEIELSLELSIGGSYGGKCEKPKQVVEESLCKDVNEKNVVPRSGFSFSEGAFVVEKWDHQEAVGQYRKMREIQAVRRREARRKRDEKLRKSATINSKGIIINLANDHDKVCLEAQQLQTRAQDREMKEKEGLSCIVIDNEAVKEESNLILKETNFSCQQKNDSVYHGNGVACFGLEEKKSMFQQAAACGSLRPYDLNGNGDTNMRCNSGNNNGSSIISSRIANQKALSNGSPDRSSSAISDYMSTSGKGGSISDTGSHSSCLHTNDRRLSLSATSGALNQAQLSGPLNNREVGKETFRAASSPKQIFLSKAPQNCTVDASGNSKPDTKSTAVTSKLTDSTSTPSKQSSEVADNPSKIQSQNFAMSSLPQMPCVSTTGNGPNGKTITGFLYRYTKSEISIVCVCHGSSFSPAEFVEHAGGIDITHPLRHITVIPSSFG